MKKLFSSIAVALLSISGANATDKADFPETEEIEFARWYVGGSAMMTLPEGDSRMRRLGGGALRAGYYFAEFWAIEAEAAALEDSAGLSTAVLWHWWGYERLDPFFTFGARGWIGNGRGQVGAKAGIGSFYHLTDYWSLRFDADVTLGLDGCTETVYTLSAGVQYSF